MPLRVDQQRRVIDFIKTYTPVDQVAEVVAEFYAFRAGEGLFSEVLSLSQGIHKMKNYWHIAKTSRSQLSLLTIRLSQTISNSVPSKRSFWTMNYIQNARRNRLKPEKTDKLAFIYMNSRVLKRIASDQPLKSLNNLTDKEIDELEQQIFSKMMANLGAKAAD